MSDSKTIVENRGKSGIRFAVRSIFAAAGVGALLVSSPQSANAFSTEVIDWAIRELCGHISGDLGSLLVAVAALGALVAAAMGSYRAFYSAIITAVGAFAISTILSLNFKEAADQCNQGGGGGGGGGAGRAATPVSATPNPGSSGRLGAAGDPFGEIEEF